MTKRKRGADIHCLPPVCPTPGWCFTHMSTTHCHRHLMRRMNRKKEEGRGNSRCARKVKTTVVSFLAALSVRCWWLSCTETHRAGRQEPGSRIRRTSGWRATYSDTLWCDEIVQSSEQENRRTKTRTLRNTNLVDRNRKKIQRTSFQGSRRSIRDSDFLELKRKGFKKGVVKSNLHYM